MNLLIADTNILIGIGKKRISLTDVAAKTLGSKAGISIVTTHELKRGARAGSPFEHGHSMDLFPVVHDVTREDWIRAADEIRTHYWGKLQGVNLIKFQNDTLIGVSAKRLGASVWTHDKGLIDFCRLIGVLTV